MEPRESHVPDLFTGCTRFSSDINGRIVQSEIEGGAHISDLPNGEALEVRTDNHAYRVEVAGPGQTSISGHPVFYPKPVLVSIHGSSWGGSMLKVAYIGRGMHLEFHYPEFETLTTSKTLEIRAAA